MSRDPHIVLATYSGVPPAIVDLVYITREFNIDRDRLREAAGRLACPVAKEVVGLWAKERVHETRGSGSIRLRDAHRLFLDFCAVRGLPKGTAEAREVFAGLLIDRVPSVTLEPLSPLGTLSGIHIEKGTDTW